MPEKNKPGQIHRSIRKPSPPSGSTPSDRLPPRSRTWTSEFDPPVVEEWTVLADGTRISTPTWDAADPTPHEWVDWFLRQERRAQEVIAAYHLQLSAEIADDLNDARLTGDT